MFSLLRFDAVLKGGQSVLSNRRVEHTQKKQARLFNVEPAVSESCKNFGEPRRATGSALCDVERERGDRIKVDVFRSERGPIDRTARWKRMGTRHGHAETARVFSLPQQCGQQALVRQIGRAHV